MTGQQTGEFRSRAGPLVDQGIDYRLQLSYQTCAHRDRRHYRYGYGMSMPWAVERAAGMGVQSAITA